MHLTPLQPDIFPALAQMFVAKFQQLRAAVPVLPDTLAAPARVVEQLAWLKGGVVAWDGAQPAGYLGWFIVPEFRGTPRTGAYCPEWGHAARGSTAAIYRALYRAAAADWAATGCGVHAISLLAHDTAAQQVWFWNNFGLTVVDAIRPMQPLDTPADSGLTVRRATPDDLPGLVALEAEHTRHYAEPPVQMAAYEGHSMDALAAFISGEHNTIWLALDGSDYAGFIRFENDGDGAAAVVAAPDQIAVTGAYVRPAYRGRRAAPHLLDAGLRHYAAQGFTRCSVDFESFNPEAAAFWPKYFTPVCLSVTRIPEQPPI